MAIYTIQYSRQNNLTMLDSDCHCEEWSDEAISTVACN
jgi:hypothetical protein